ncbi:MULTISPECIES: hypothetical protein [Pseudoalteromonas]|uniref:hypothetical protein n=1 Tax=Pseudoalteromonas TaxID=53246 RepID=UPI002097A07A|nr:hypothetical protein [Pseudoalteromonas sp. OANN1]MCO7199724.1 hypothetical protein [Pseudoalteromonas sp. OANN1]
MKLNELSNQPPLKTTAGLATIGTGASAITASRKSSPFGPYSKLEECIKEIPTRGEYELTATIKCIEDSKQLNEITNHKSGLSINLGFFSFGHKHSNTLEMKRSSRYVYFLACARREGKTRQLELEEPNAAADEVYKQSPSMFYKDYGSAYLKGQTHGLYCYVLFEFEFDSKAEAEKAKTDITASITTDDGTGGGSIGSGKSFSEKCKELKAVATYDTNLKDVKIDSQDIPGLLALVNQVAERDVSQAPAMIDEYAPYLSHTHEDLINRVDDVKNVLETYKVSENLELYKKIESDLALALQHKEDFVEQDEIAKSKDYYGELISILEEVVKKLDANIYSDVIEKNFETYSALLKKQGEYITAEELTRKQLSLGKHGFKSTKTDESALENTINSIIGSTNGYCNKYSASGHSDSGHIQGLVIYSRNKIDVKTSVPANITWKSTQTNYKAHEHLSVGENHLKDWIEENLTPWQFFHCSVVTAFNKKSGKTHYAVVYPNLPG